MKTSKKTLANPAHSQVDVHSHINDPKLSDGGGLARWLHGGGKAVVVWSRPREPPP